MKKLIIFGLIFCLLSSFIVACGTVDTDTATKESETESTDTSADSSTEIDSDSETEIESESDTETETETETETKTETETETETESVTETESESETETETESNTESDSESDTESNTESDTESNTESETDTETDTDKEPVEPVIQKQNWDDDGVLKILAIGNSFSDDAMEYVYQVAKDAGVKKIYLGNMYIGGCTLEKHLSNAKNNKGAYDFRTNSNGTWSSRGGVSIQTAVTSENWDFITFQQASGYSGIASTYDDLNELISIVEPLCPGARLAWHMTWAYKVGSTHSDFPKYNKDQMTMYNAIVDSVNTKILTNDKIEIVIPSGTSVQNLRTSYIGDVTRDGYHLDTGIGRYLASMTFVKALTGLSIDNSITRPNNVDGYELVVLIDCVNNALAKPYEITTSQYQSQDEVEISENIVPEGYVQLTAEQMGLTAASFYISGSNSNMNSGTDNWYKGFMATKKFTREELPVGSIIEIAEGWQYRPEGWKYTGTRPANVTLIRIVIDEDWWGSYTERAFNISQTSHTSSKNNPITLTTDEVASAIFKIIVPESAIPKTE